LTKLTGASAVGVIGRAGGADEEERRDEWRVQETSEGTCACSAPGLPPRAGAGSSQQLKRGAQQLLGADLTQSSLLSQLGERRAGLALAKAEPA
jgi:hypothetical protein